MIDPVLVVTAPLLLVGGPLVVLGHDGGDVTAAAASALFLVQTESVRGDEGEAVSNDVGG